MLAHITSSDVLPMVIVGIGFALIGGYWALRGLTR